MSPIAPGPFRAALADRSTAEFAAFVAALYRAAGYDAAVDAGADPPAVAVDGRRLRVHHPGPLARRIGAAAVPGPAGADGVVTSVRSGREGVVDAAALRERTLYGVDAADRDRLCDEHLGLDPAAVPDGPARNESRTDAGPGRRRAALAVLAVLAVAAGLAVAGPGGGPGASGADGPRFEPLAFEGPDGDGTASPTVSPAATPATTTSVALRSSATPAPSPRNASYPPGLSPGGIVDADALADAHAGAVTGRSYRLRIVVRTSEGGRPVGLRREVARVAGPTRYASTVRSAGDPRPAGVVGPAAYADGTTRIVRAPGGARSGRARLDHGEGYYADRVERYLRWYLSVNRSTVVGTYVENGTRLYWVSLSGDPWPGVADASGTALVDEQGVVHRLHRSHDVPGEPGVSVTVTVGYVFGPVAVDEPAWVADATDATAGNATGGSRPTTGTATPAVGSPEPARLRPRSPTAG